MSLSACIGRANIAKLVACVLLELVLTITVADAACSPAADSTPNPPPGTTVTCSGNTNNANFAHGLSAGFGTGNQTGITVNVNNSAVVSGTNIGIYVGDSTVTNGTGATISGANAGIYNASGAANVTNSGSISGDGGVFAQTNATVINNAGATITGNTAGIYASTGYANVTNSGSITATTDGILTGAGGSSVFNTGVISGGSAAIVFSGVGNTLTLGPGTNVTGNVLGTGSDTFQLGGSGTATFDTSQIGAAAQYQGFGTFNKVGSSTWTLINTTATTTSWNLDQGTLSVSSDANLGSAAGSLNFNGGVLQVTGTSFTSTPRAIIWGVNGGGFDIANPANTFTISQALGPGGALTKLGAGTLVLDGTNTYTGATTVSAGTLTLGVGGSVTSTVTNNATFNNFGTVTGGLINNGTAANGATITGAVNNAAAFSNNTGSTVLGLLTNTAGTTTDNGALNGGANVSGGTFTGTGSVSNLTVTGGSFSPGNGAAGSLMTVTGNLALQSAAQYLVQVNPATSSFTHINGTATLGGASVQATFAAGSYIAKQYQIMTAAGGLTGGFGTLTNNNLPAGFTSSLSYDANDAYLNLALSYASGNLNQNQSSVANAIANYFNSNGSIPVAFGGLSPSGLTQISGELATGTQQATSNAMSLFVGLLTDPFFDNRNEQSTPDEQARPFAEDNSTEPSMSQREAYAAVAGTGANTFAKRWSVWTAGYGGSEVSNGSATLGSNNATSKVYGGVAGADYSISPSTLVGFALAGGGTTFNVANSLGSGRSDLFQAGAFFKQAAGPAYVRGALAYGWQDVTTNRTVTVAGWDRLQAKFNANAFSGRLEGGYRFANGWLAVTPYAAGQFTVYELPAYFERAVAGTNNFALGYTAKSVTTPRSEIGFRTDKSWAFSDAVLTLRSRFAWAHNFNTSDAISATFQTLPGASFIVNGAAQAANTALTTASAELKWANGFSLATTFEGEFSQTTASYAGKGVIRYTW